MVVCLLRPKHSTENTGSSENQLENVLAKMCEIEQKVSRLEDTIRALSEHHDSPSSVQLDDSKQGSHTSLEEVLNRPNAAEFGTQGFSKDEEDKEQ